MCKTKKQILGTEIVTKFTFYPVTLPLHRLPMFLDSNRVAMHDLQKTNKKTNNFCLA